MTLNDAAAEFHPVEVNPFGRSTRQALTMVDDVDFILTVNRIENGALDLENGIAKSYITRTSKDGVPEVGDTVFLIAIEYQETAGTASNCEGLPGRWRVIERRINMYTGRPFVILERDGSVAHMLRNTINATTPWDESNVRDRLWPVYNDLVANVRDRVQSINWGPDDEDAMAS